MRESKSKPIPRSSSVTAQRSDQIRHRRAEKARPSVPVSGGQRKKSRLGVSQRIAARNGPPAPPPVMARGAATSPLTGGAYERTQSKRVQRARRTYNIAVGSQGAEMRLPAIPRIHIGWRLASFLIAGLLIFGLYQLWTAPLYRVNEGTLQIYGLQRLSDASVRSVLAVKDKPSFALDVQAMQENLLADFPEFSAAIVTIELPNTVVVTVTERVPVLIWRQDGRTSLVDAEGMLFPLRDESVQTNYPVVEASSTPPAPPLSLVISDEQRLSEAAGEGRSASAVESPFTTVKNTASGILDRTPARPFLFPEMVSAILSLAAEAPEGAVLTYDVQHGLGWKDRRGWEVYFGDVLKTKNGDIEMKLRVYKSILEYLKTQDTKPALISVEYVHAPYYRLAGVSGD